MTIPTFIGCHASCRVDQMIMKIGCMEQGSRPEFSREAVSVPQGLDRDSESVDVNL